MPRDRRRRRRADPVALDVFLNLAFDASTEWLLVAQVSGLAALGFTARSVLEIHGADRLERLLDIIAACGVSISDMSWVRAKDIRHNMPFELGLAVALADRFEPRLKFFVSDREPLRLKRTLSDLGGHDAIVHRGDPRVLLTKLHERFVGPEPRPTIAQMRQVHRVVVKSVPRIRQELDSEDLFNSSCFAALCATAREATDQIVVRPRASPAPKARTRR